MTGINMLAIHIAWPLAGLLCILFLGEKIADDWRCCRRAPWARLRPR